MIGYEEALKAVLRNTAIMPSEKVPTEESVGRILREDIYSGIAMPPFNKSAMDGYAVKAKDTKKVPVMLECIGLIQAGETLNRELKHGECAKIMTGAPMPQGADSVIMVEDTRLSDDCVEARKAVKTGENVCRKAEDIKIGQKIIEKGTKVLTSHIAILAAVGRSSVEAAAKPSVTLLNTGGEIIPAGKRLTENRIYNSNGPMLQAMLKSDGIEPCFLGIAKDNVKELRKAVREGLKSHILLISGGVSAGDYDLVPQVLKDLGIKRIFHTVRIKPGKPLFFGVIKKSIIFGIPGNPVSNFLAYLIFIQPALRKMMGHRSVGPVFREGLIDRDFKSKARRKHFVPAKISVDKDCYHIHPLLCHGSADIRALSKADAFMVLDYDRGSMKKYSRVQFITWKEIGQ